MLARFFPVFLGVFHSSSRTAQRDRENFQCFRSSSAALGSVPASSGCLSRSKGHVCDHCLPPGSREVQASVSLLLLSSIHRCPSLKNLLFQLSRSRGCLSPALSEKNHVLKDNNNTETPNQNQKITHQKVLNWFPYHPALKHHLSRRLNSHPKASPVCFINYWLHDKSWETPHTARIPLCHLLYKLRSRKGWSPSQRLFAI